MVFKRQRTNGETVYVSDPYVIVKRGVTYFLYMGYADALADDKEVDKNLARMNAGQPVFNRCYSGKWLRWSKRLNFLYTCSEEGWYVAGPM